MSPEYFIIPIILPLIMSFTTNIVTNLATGIYLLDCLFIILIIIIILTIDFSIFKDNITSYLMSNITYITNKNNMIILLKTNDIQSNNFKAVMHYASKSNNKTIYSLQEYFTTGWDKNDNNIEKESGYIIDQLREFQLDEDIYGILSYEKREKRRELQNTEFTKITILKIYTKNKSLVELQDWINTRLDEYNKYICLKSTRQQLLINISSDMNDDIIVEGVPWESTINFENSYFAEMDDIIKKLNFFNNNKIWYIEHGIPYNMGILLYGKPGCGKTRFIKMLMNHTKRHGIDIKLNDNMDFTKLKNIIYCDKIGENYNIPQENRIIIFEDIDCMSKVVEDRDLKKKNEIDISIEKSLNNELMESIIEMKKDSPNKKKDNSKYNNRKNNNLSYLLNILDGLNECSGRIIIMTTNKIDILDEALIRPGRIDMKIEFKKCTCYDVYRMIKIFWKESIIEDDIQKDIDNKYTSAEITNIFRSTDNFNDIKHYFIN